MLKEGLKTLCEVNQWSYAVFWKIGCQNPKVLIWEECYYVTKQNPEDFNACRVLAEASNLDEGDKVHLLVNKMMMDSHFNIVGEGLVGRVAFTGNHQWILSETYCGDSHPPEVVKEVCQQFSAGMQTVAVIPVLPHGVVQFGSCMKVMENLQFINDVTSLMFELGHVSEAKEDEPRIGFPIGNSNSLNYVHNTNQVSISLVERIQNELLSNGALFHTDGIRHQHYSEPMINGVPKAEVISLNSELWRNQNISPHLNCSKVGGARLSVEEKVLFNGGASIRCLSESADGNTDSIEPKNEMFHELEPPNANSSLIPGFVQDDTNQIPQNDVFVQPELGDDLFDILGADFKNNLLSCRNSFLSNESAPNMPSKKMGLSTSQGNSESGIFSSAGTDHLLGAVVSKIQPCSKQSTDDTVSCKTTSTNSSFVPNNSLPYGRFDPLEGEFFGVPKYTSKTGATSSFSKEELRSYSRESSIYGSQISSWMEKDQKAKPNSSDEAGKANRKRLKPGENPRPRPKDRQMFQDRVKELREIVPNGAKCSLDALLERTIKHMLFLQSVTKHADKLKQTGESKISSKDGGLVLKDNYEGGATWAYEVGSQTMVCPIIVEDLNQPRQMLVQMLCEERGLFLEIADIIRGLGLTILKGVMETRNDKIWARFSVEANRDVTRMEIFISLVRLLEQSSIPISNEFNSFIQPSIPHSLQ